MQTDTVRDVLAKNKKSPVGLKYVAGLDEPTATFLQTMAWETVQDYFLPRSETAKN